MRSALISAVVANVKSNPLMPISWVYDDLEAIAAPAADVVMLQEIAPRNYKVAARARLKAWRLAGMNRETPIAYPGTWKTIKAWTKRRHLGVPHITPARFDTMVKAVTPEGFKVLLIDVHMVSEAWTHNDRTTKLRRSLWRKHHKRTHKAIASHRDVGYTVIIGGDLNHPGMVTWGPNQVNVLDQGLLQLAVLPADGVSARVHTAGRAIARKAHTDHPIMLAGIELETAPS